jgi:hypothetical protein
MNLYYEALLKAMLTAVATKAMNITVTNIPAAI